MYLKIELKWEYIRWLTNLYKVNEKFCSEKQTNKNAKVKIELQDSNDKLTLDVSCEDCEDQCSGKELNSNKCNRKGDLVCGGCNCK